MPYCDKILNDENMCWFWFQFAAFFNSAEATTAASSDSCPTDVCQINHRLFINNLPHCRQKYFPFLSFSYSVSFSWEQNLFLPWSCLLQHQFRGYKDELASCTWVLDFTVGRFLLPPPLSIFNPDEWPGMEGTRDLMKMKRPKGAKLKKGYSLSESGWNELQSSALYGR